MSECTKKNTYSESTYWLYDAEARAIFSHSSTVDTTCQTFMHHFWKCAMSISGFAVNHNHSQWLKCIHAMHWIMWVVSHARTLIYLDWIACVPYVDTSMVSQCLISIWTLKSVDCVLSMLNIDRALLWIAWI